MIGHISATAQPGETITRFVGLIKDTAESDLCKAMDKANLLFSLTNYDLSRGRVVFLPLDTGELVATIGAKVGQRVGELRAQHLDELADSLQTQLEQFRENAKSIGYHINY